MPVTVVASILMMVVLSARSSEKN